MGNSVYVITSSGKLARVPFTPWSRDLLHTALTFDDRTGTEQDAVLLNELDIQQKYYKIIYIPLVKISLFTTTDARRAEFD